MRHRIVILCGPQLTHKNTCATLIRYGLNVVGICVADQRTAGLPLLYLKKMMRRKGFGVMLSRSLARVLYLFRNSRHDREISAQLFDRQSIEQTLQSWSGEIHRTGDYSAPETMAWLKAMQPDILVVHTPYWVGKKVRALPATGIVLGGHPGLTPFYRGSHSPFWAVYRGKPDDVGCTVFLLDDGVDTGDIVAQARVAVEAGDSFVTLSWKGMIRIAQMQAEVLGRLDSGMELPRKRLPIPPDTEFDNPTLSEYLAYTLRQKAVR